ncbi:MAG: hypothetical protein P8101_11665 [Candidatus Thiodiazotropha sp.]
MRLLSGSEFQLSPISLLAEKLAHATVDKAQPHASALVPVICQSQLSDNNLSIHLPNGISLRGIALDNQLGTAQYGQLLVQEHAEIIFIPE